jgi:hypothetical protein
MANRFCTLTGTNKIKDEFDNINDGFDEVENELDASDNRMDNHVNGLAEKHTTTHLTNASNMPGTTLTDVLNNAKIRMDDHVAGTTEKHGSSAITNQSSQSGTSVTDAINSLAGVVQTINVGDSNANIGVYSLNASGTNTITTTFVGLTYFAGLKINLSIANDNTGSVTVNLNSLGAKNLYKVVGNVKTALLPRDVRQGEIASIQYDGTDFILTNGERNPEYSTTQVSTSDISTLQSTAKGLMDSFVVEGRTIVNLLPDEVAGCESTSGWTPYVSSVATDTENKSSGTNCLKITLSGANGGIYYDNFSKFKQGNYYIAIANIKNGNATYIDFILNFTGDASLNASGTVTSTNYIRKAVLIQPSDFNSATNAYFIIDVVGVSTQYAFVDELMLIEISSTEYALGVDALLSKYGFHLGTKSTDKCRIKIVDENSFDGELEKGYIDSSGNQPDYHQRTKNYTKVEGNTQYYINFFTSSAATYAFFYDEKRNYISSAAYGSVGYIDVTTPSNCSYIRAYTATPFTTSSKCMISKGATAKTYEPYKKTTAIIPVELREVPSIACSFDCLTGKHTKNVEKYNLVADDIASLSALTNVSIVSIAKPADYKSKTLGYNATFNDVLYSGYTIGTFVDDVAYIGKIFMQDSTYWGIIVSKTKYADLATAKTALAGTDIFYQLLTPETTYYTPSTLLASSNGTIYQEKGFHTDFLLYTNSNFIPFDPYWMVEILEVRKWNLGDGSYELVPLMDVTLTSGAISAIVGVTEGDFYTVDALLTQSNYINGELNYSYPVDAMGQIEVNSKEIYKSKDDIRSLQTLIENLAYRVYQLENP